MLQHKPSCSDLQREELKAVYKLEWIKPPHACMVEVIIAAPILLMDILRPRDLKLLGPGINARDSTRS